VGGAQCMARGPRVSAPISWGLGGAERGEVLVDGPKWGEVGPAAGFLFFFYLFLSLFFLFRFKFEFEFWSKTCATLIFITFVKLRIPILWNIIILFIFLYHFSPYFQNPSFNLGFDLTSSIYSLIILIIIIIILFNAQT
jgi:hypothetical protein